MNADTEAAIRHIYEQLTWEYPRATPDGDQIDLVEVMDVSGGLITHHRVYWGWVGFKMLSNLRAGTK
jgi:steroid Delta-isomerase